MTIPVVSSSPGQSDSRAWMQSAPSRSWARPLSGWLDGDENRSFSRRPRRVVPLRWDELQGCYIEVERVSLGEDNLVLAMDDAEAKVKDLLQRLRPPRLERVQDASGHARRAGCSSSMPRSSRSRSNSHDRRPHAAGPAVPFGLDDAWRLRPSWASSKVVVTSIHQKSSPIGRAESVTIESSDRRPRRHIGRAPCISSNAEGELALLTLANYDLSDGEYFALNVHRRRKEAQIEFCYPLRSADTPLHQVGEADMHLVYSPAKRPALAVAAGPPTGPNYVNGARVLLGPR